MLKKLPIYDIFINLDDPETTVSFNSLVASPAHEKAFQMFSEDEAPKKVEWQFNEEERIITGVAIACDLLIPRHQQGHSFYVRFGKQAIKDIVFDYARRGNFNNLNLHHDGKKVVDGAYMTMLYQIDKLNGFTTPERFKDESDGSLLVSYKITDDEVWQAGKEGKFTGFSIEGIFELGDPEQMFTNQLLTILKQIK
jgi:hypothetical protein